MNKGIVPITFTKGKPVMPTFNKIIDRDNMYKAYNKTLRGRGKFHPEAIKFSNDETFNMNTLIESLENESYKFEGYIRFPVFEPKERIVDAPHFQDKIVQLAINSVLKEIYNPCFIFDSYACIDNKGTHKCVDRIQYFMRKAKWEYGDAAGIAKMDVKKFFYSIDREILKKLLLKKIKCKKTLRLIFKIIDSAELIDPLGLPLGNTLSQICANIYMNEVDNYVKRKLSIKYYIRYMDDSIVIMPSITEAEKVLELVRVFIRDNLALELNEKKSKVFPLAQGVNAVGYKIHPTHRLLRNDCKKKIKRKIKAFPHLIATDKMTVRKAEQMLNSWLGHASHARSYNFIQSLIKKNNYIYLNSKNTLKINPSKLKEGVNRDG